MLSNLPSTPRVCLCSLTHTQGLPRHRLPLMPSQNASLHVPAHHSSTRVEVTQAASTPKRICRLRRDRLGRCQTRCLFTSCRWRQTGVQSSRPQPRGHRCVGTCPARAVRRPSRRGVPRTQHRPSRLCLTSIRVPGAVPRQSCHPRQVP